MRVLQTASMIQHTTNQEVDVLCRSGFRPIKGDVLHGVGINPFYKSPNKFIVLTNHSANCGVVVSRQLGKRVLSFAMVI